MLLATGDQIRKADQVMIEELDFPGVLLMEEAGRKAANFILDTCPDHSRFLVLAGPGNNGGDGFVIARYLMRWGKSVQIILSHAPDRYAGDAGINLKALNGSRILVRIWPEHPGIDDETVLIDALLGTGINSEIRGVILEMVHSFAAHQGPVIAIDMPSGLLADTGKVLSKPLKADYTLTFQLPKICHAVYPAANFCGTTCVADIGIWNSVIGDLGINRHWMDGQEARDILKHHPRPVEGHKGTFGHVALIGGSNQYPGAIALSGHAALHAGAGLSTVIGTEHCRTAIFGMGPEVIFRAVSGERINRTHLDAVLEWTSGCTIGIGPGWSTHPEVKEFFLTFLEKTDRPLVLDADALNLIAFEQCWDLIPPKSVITPHPGEIKRLLRSDQGSDQRLEQAEQLAKDKNLVVVLKGAGTVVASPNKTWVNTSGNSGMGTGGSGDVLTGVITSLLAQGHQPASAAALGVYLHGLAGDLATQKFGAPGLTASRIMEHLGPAMVTIIERQEPQITTI